MATIRKQRPLGRVGVSGTGAATRIGGSTVPTNSPPVYLGGAQLISITEGQASTITLATRFQDPDGHTMTYAWASHTVPGITLNTTSGLVSIAGTLAVGLYNIQFSANDGNGGVTPTPVITVQITSVPVITGDLTVTANWGYKAGIHVDASVKWNTYKKDIYENIIGWCDGDHGEKVPPLAADSNSVRYLNLGTTERYGIPAGTEGYLVEPGYTNPAHGGITSKVSEYDNYMWWYVPSDNMFFWLNNTNETVAGGDRNGIFDFKLNPPDWSHGNRDVNSSQWPTGPWWFDYVDKLPSGSNIGFTKNSPHAWSEAMDKGVIITVPGSDCSLVFIERNPAYPRNPSAPPFKFTRATLTSQATYPYKILASTSFRIFSETGAEGWDDGHINSGICIGEWFYFLRNPSEPEKLTYPDIVVDGVVYEGKRQEELWRVRLVAPYTQFEKLAMMPRKDIVPVMNVMESIATGTVDGVPAYMGSTGPLLVHDEDSNSILALFDRLWRYDIDANVWKDITPPGAWYRHVHPVGALRRVNEDPSKREIVFRGGSRVDSGVPQIWSRVVLEGGQKPRARYVTTTLDMAYPGYSSTRRPWGGKHARYVYLYSIRRTDGTLQVGSAESGGSAVSGYVYRFGGDFQGIPFATNPPLYPAGNYAQGSGRQDFHRAPVREIAGKVQIELACNHVAFYPYPGGPDPATTQKGPAHPDGIGLIQDKRGDVWVGPGYYRFPLTTTPPSAGLVQPMGVYRFRLPTKHTNGVRMGNGWYHPPQNYLVVDTASKVNADDITIGNDPGTALFGGSNCWSEYDPKDDAIILISNKFDGSNFRLYKFPLETLVETEYAFTTSTSTESIIMAGVTPFPFANGDLVAFVKGTPPGGLTQSAQYQVMNVGTDRCQITNVGGSTPINLSSLAGTGCVVGKVTHLQYKWQRWTQPVDGAARQAFENSQCRNGATATGTRWTGSQVLINDHLYVHTMRGGGTITPGVRDDVCAYIARYNIRNLAEPPQYIAIPTYHARNWDAPQIIPGSETPGSINEFREIRGLGHMLVLSPCTGDGHYQPNEPLLRWYDTNRETWTAGQTYDQIVAANPDPAWPTEYTSPDWEIVCPGPAISKGMFCVVPETGEVWIMTNGDNTSLGIIKYRIW